MYVLLPILLLLQKNCLSSGLPKMLQNNLGYKMENITYPDGTDPSLNLGVQLLEQLLKNCFTDNKTHSNVLPDEDVADGGPNCPRSFDGFTCWDPTPAKMTAFQSCPDYVVGFDSRRPAYKRCMADGTWETHPERGKAWTNYTSCVDVNDLDFRSIINDIYVYGYMVSVAALLLSIAIFMFFRIPYKYKTRAKTLYCTRIRIHINLFTAFALNNMLWIVWYKKVINDVAVLQENKDWCQVVHVLTYYFMVTSYLWMFCEGLHLHIALVVVFVRDIIPMSAFMFFGWGTSIIVIASYVITRMTKGETIRCWTESSDSFWIIIAPVALSLFLSLIFLGNVIRVLIMKLYPATNYNVSIAIKKAARAALILIPLFGLQFMLIPYRPGPDSPNEKTYQVVSALLTSLQGTCVAILFCFTNQEVHVAIQSYFHRVSRQNEGIPMTGITAGESVVHIREHVV